METASTNKRETACAFSSPDLGNFWPTFTAQFNSQTQQPWQNLYPNLSKQSQQNSACDNALGSLAGHMWCGLVQPLAPTATTSADEDLIYIPHISVRKNIAGRHGSLQWGFQLPREVILLPRVADNISSPLCIYSSRNKKRENLPFTENLTDQSHHLHSRNAQLPDLPCLPSPFLKGLMVPNGTSVVHELLCHVAIFMLRMPSWLQKLLETRE